MRAVVLVGGEGTRLRPLTLSTPKQLIPVAEVAMLERVLAHLASHGVEEAVLSMGYQADAFLAAFPEGACGGVRLSYAVEPEPLDTAGGIAFAARAAGIEDTFLAVNSDVLTDIDVSALLDFHHAKEAEGTVALTPVEDPSSYGVVSTDDSGRVTAFIEKPDRASAPTRDINAGIYVLEPSVIDRVGAGARVNIERETFPAMVADRTLFALGSMAYWIDTGTPELLLRASLDLISGIRGEPPAPGAREIDPGVWAIGAAVLDGALEQPCLVGDAAFVGAGAHVSRSVVGSGARVEAGATVEGSLLLPGAVVKHGAVVENSIVGQGALVQEGARLSGLTVVQGGAVVGEGTSLEGARIPA